MEKTLNQDPRLAVRRLTAPSEALAEAFGRLMPQLSPRLGGLDGERIRRILDSERTALFAVGADGRIEGLLTLVWYDVPSGRKAWIEDVVVDEASRGRGAGRLLVGAALDHARRIGADKVMLTSSVHRVAAHALYLGEGFVQVATDVFAYGLQ